MWQQRKTWRWKEQMDKREGMKMEMLDGREGMDGMEFA